MLQRTFTQALSAQLADRLTERIDLRLLSPGTRLPSIRATAQAQGVSPATVVAAYDQLVARGRVVAEPKKGFYVAKNQANGSYVQHPGQLLATEIIANSSPESTASGSPATPAPGRQVPLRHAPLRHAPLSAAALIRGMFNQKHLLQAGLDAPKPQPSMGVLPQEWLENDFLAQALRQVVRGDALQQVSLHYGDPMGDLPLRTTLANRLQQLQIPASTDQIITTCGATHALDIASRTLLRAGDAVMVEEPGWAVEFARLEALGMRILPVPRGPSGPDLSVMQRYCAVDSPKLFVSVSVLHNPTGLCLSPSAAHSVLQLAQQHDFYVMEDDTYAYLTDEHATRMAALDGLRRTIYVGGFAKILAPGWRVGFLAAPLNLVERITDTKLLTTLTTPALLERALSVCIDKGQLRHHAQGVRAQLAAARARSAQLAREAGCTFAAEPAGLFGWVDTGVDTDALSQRMLDFGYLLAPGSLFHAVRKPSTLMRINFASTQTPEFWRVFERVRGGMR